MIRHNHDFPAPGAAFRPSRTATQGPSIARTASRSVRSTVAILTPAPTSAFGAIRTASRERGRGGRRGRGRRGFRLLTSPAQCAGHTFNGGSD